MMQAARHRLESDEELQNHTNDLRSMLDCREPRTTRCATLLHARQTKSQTIAASLTNKTATPIFRIAAFQLLLMRLLKTARSRDHRFLLRSFSAKKSHELDEILPSFRRFGLPHSVLCDSGRHIPLP